MIPRIPDAKGLKKAFHVAYSSKEKTAIGDERQLRVRKKIRRIGPLKSDAGFWSVLENSVWGFSPGSSILTLALTILCVRMYLNLGHDYFSMAASHLGKVTLAKLLGYEG
jgi:hypothetical protein